MSKSVPELNVHVISASKTEMTNNLLLHLSPLIYDCIRRIYKDAAILFADREKQFKKAFKSRLEAFKKLMEEIKIWNESLIQEETEIILKEFPWMGKLLNQIFKCHVIILAAPRISHKPRNVKLVFPKPESFIHRVLIKVYENSCHSWHLYDSNVSAEQRTKNSKKIKKLIDESIVQAIHFSLPVANIIEEYLSKEESDDEEEKTPIMAETANVLPVMPEQNSTPLMHEEPKVEEIIIAKDEKEGLVIEENPNTPQQPEEDPRPVPVAEEKEEVEQVSDELQQEFEEPPKVEDEVREPEEEIVEQVEPEQSAPEPEVISELPKAPVPEAPKPKEDLHLDNLIANSKKHIEEWKNKPKPKASLLLNNDQKKTIHITNGKKQ
jgi:hypothetical protein